MTNALIHIFIRDAENTGDSRVREKFGVLSGAVGLACNLFLFALKLIIGLLTGSISIAADAFNNLSDGLSCLISIVGFKVSGKEPDAKHPFGYGRTEYLSLIHIYLAQIGEPPARFGHTGQRMPRNTRPEGTYRFAGRVPRTARAAVHAIFV